MPGLELDCPLGLMWHQPAFGAELARGPVQASAGDSRPADPLLRRSARSQWPGFLVAACIEFAELVSPEGEDTTSGYVEAYAVEYDVVIGLAQPRDGDRALCVGAHTCMVQA